MFFVFALFPQAFAQTVPLRQVILDDETYLLQKSAGSFLSLESSQEIPYYENLRKFIESISRYGRSLNPQFGIVLLNGLNLFFKPSDSYTSEIIVDSQFTSFVDGLVLQGYKYSTFQYMNLMPDTVADPFYKKNHDDLIKILKTEGVPIFFVDYTMDPRRRLDSIRSAYREGFMANAFSSPRLSLTNTLKELPVFQNETTVPITVPSMAKNFLFLPSFSFESATKREQAIRLTDNNYDFMIIPPFYRAQAFSQSEVRLMKHKKVGAPRLVYAYINIGQVDRNMYYWKDAWEKTSPSFFLPIPSPNNMNFVHINDPQWQQIFIGSRSSFIYALIAQGFDGVVLDGLDTADYLRGLDRGTISPVQ